jgi:ATP-dependent RecD-like DNA helicase SH3 domain
MQRGALGARSLNADLQKALNPNPSARIEKFGSLFAPGDKIMQTENDYARDVFNGDLQTVLRIDENEGLFCQDQNTFIPLPSRIVRRLVKSAYSAQSRFGGLRYGPPEHQSRDHSTQFVIGGLCCRT